MKKQLKKNDLLEQDGELLICNVKKFLHLEIDLSNEEHLDFLKVYCEKNKLPFEELQLFLTKKFSVQLLETLIKAYYTTRRIKTKNYKERGVTGETILKKLEYLIENDKPITTTTLLNKVEDGEIYLPPSNLSPVKKFIQDNINIIEPHNKKIKMSKYVKDKKVDSNP